MPWIQFEKYGVLLAVLPFTAWILSLTPEIAPEKAPEKVNLALRRTADGLLRAAGDSTSRIPAVEQVADGIWRVRLESSFEYDSLPSLLQQSLDLYGIRDAYEVTVRRCADAMIDLGYQKADLSGSEGVPCTGRSMPKGCHYLEISFVHTSPSRWFMRRKGLQWIALLGSIGLGLWLLLRRRPAQGVPILEWAPWLKFGQSRLDVAGQVLECGGMRQDLTFREAKLLRLFVTHSDQLLEREFILTQVWADEGVLVGRSVDVFVSRLRKKLSADPSVSIVAVHGVGYRLETGKMA